MTTVRSSAVITEELLESLKAVVNRVDITSSKDELEKVKRETPERIVFATHSETFHCDEVAAIAMLLAKYIGSPDYDKSAPLPLVLRTRDPSLLAQANVVVDVGGEYNEGKGVYDHHQRGFDVKFDEEHTTTKMSSAGLVYRHFGKEMLSGFFGEYMRSVEGKTAEAVVELVHGRVYDTLIEYIDARDNGVSVSSDGEMKYLVSTDLGTRVSKLNTRWYEDNWSAEATNAKFRMALHLVVGEIVAAVEEAVYDWCPARTVVEEAIKARHSVAPHGMIITPRVNCPFNEHIYSLEKELGADEIKYVVYRTGHNAFRVRAVAKSNQTFECRLPLPETLRGVKGDELKTITEIDSIQFVHAAGFIGGAGSLEDGIRLAQYSLDHKKRAREEA